MADENGPPGAINGTPAAMNPKEPCAPREKRGCAFQVRVTEEERALLIQLARRRGVSSSDVVRSLIRAAAKEMP